jgi:chorismate mutase/prephenate dehydratase
MTLDDYRSEIDRIDREVIRLLQERQMFSTKIGETKRARGVSIYAPDREEALLCKLEGLAGETLPSKAIRTIYREIISLSICAQMGNPVAYLGPEGTYTQQAALKSFGSSVPMRAMPSIPDVFAAVERGEAIYGVIPIENSTEGAVVHSLDMLAESGLKIVAQVYLSIEHCLLSRHPLKAIRRVASKDIALAQCRNWLQRNLPGVELLPVESTAAAVRRMETEPDIAAIASAASSSIYGVPILVQGIQDKTDNVTRFLVVSATPNPSGALCEEKTSLVFSLRHEPGALQKALQPFSDRGLNLTRIESRPNRRIAWEYLFFIDLIAHWQEPRMQDAIDELKKVCDGVKWLGSYPNSGNI